MSVKVAIWSLGITILILLAILFGILSDGAGGPVIVIDPPGDELAKSTASVRPAKWSIKCDGESAIQAYGSAGFPPSIPSRFLHTNGVHEVEVIPDPGYPVTRIDLVVTDGTLSHSVRVDVPKPDERITWQMGGRVVIRNENRWVHWPTELMGEITSIKFNESGEEMLPSVDKIELRYNKRWGIPNVCN